VDEARVQTTPGRATRWWVVLPWAVGGLVFFGRVWSHWHSSDAWDWVSTFGVVIIVAGVVMLWRGPGTVRSRQAAGLFVAAGALMWFLDVNVDRLDPGQPHRTSWLLLTVALFGGIAGCLTVAFARVRAERELWQPTGFLGRQ
jgi:hypothetical protein